jgi:hypothetical protein
MFTLGRIINFKHHNHSTFAIICDDLAKNGDKVFAHNQIWDFLDTNGRATAPFPYWANNKACKKVLVEPEKFPSNIYNAVVDDRFHMLKSSHVIVELDENRKAKIDDTTRKARVEFVHNLVEGNPFQRLGKFHTEEDNRVPTDGSIYKNLLTNKMFVYHENYFMQVGTQNMMVLKPFIRMDEYGVGDRIKSTSPAWDRVGICEEIRADKLIVGTAINNVLYSMNEYFKILAAPDEIGATTLLAAVCAENLDKCEFSVLCHQIRVSGFHDTLEFIEVPVLNLHGKATIEFIDKNQY